MKFFTSVAAVYGRRWMVVVVLFVAFPCSLVAQTNAAPASTNAWPTSPSTNAAPVTASVPAQTDPFSDPLIKEVQTRHDKAVKGDAQAARTLTADLEKWTIEQPTNYLLQAYLGSIYTIDSRNAWPGPGKLTFLRNGVKWLDGAVASAPDNPAVRFIRAIDYYELPFIFGKGKTARDDFQILLKQIDGDTRTAYILNIDTQQAIYYYAGLSCKQLSQMPQAKDAWVRGYKLAPTSDLGKKIGDELMKVK